MKGLLLRGVQFVYRQYMSSLSHVCPRVEELIRKKTALCIAYHACCRGACRHTRPDTYGFNSMTWQECAAVFGTCLTSCTAHNSMFGVL